MAAAAWREDGRPHGPDPGWLIWHELYWEAEEQVETQCLRNEAAARVLWLPVVDVGVYHAQRQAPLEAVEFLSMPPYQA